MKTSGKLMRLGFKADWLYLQNKWDIVNFPIMYKIINSVSLRDSFYSIGIMQSGLFIRQSINYLYIYLYIYDSAYFNKLRFFFYQTVGKIFLLDTTRILTSQQSTFCWVVS